MGPVGDCTLCSKNHYVDECFTGDIHYDATTGDVYIYNEKTWMMMSSAGAPLVATSSGVSTGAHMHVPTSKSHRGTDFPPAKVYDEFPTRLQFVSDEMNRHLPVTMMSKSSTRCTCGHSDGNYSEHLAQVSIDACDKWDELLMAEEGVSA